jgi:hypothetical protein
MNQKKSTQLRKMAEIYLERSGTKYLSKAQYKAKKYTTVADDRLFVVYRKMVNLAKFNYNKMPTPIKERLGAEWAARISEEY